MIAERRIAIGGKPVETPATLLTSLHGVTVDGQPVTAPAPARLFRYHKPTGLLTAARDPKGRPTIYDRLPAGLPRVMPVGRLDMNTEGLLLLTTDGELKRQLELPSSAVERTYRARVFGDISQERLEELIHGIEIEGIRYGAIDANLERRTGRNGWVEMKLTEGKNREVRRVLEHLGLQVSRLIRTAYGPFELQDLPVGVVDEVRQHDLVMFRKGLKSSPAPAGEGDYAKRGGGALAKRAAGSPETRPRSARPLHRPVRRGPPPRKAGEESSEDHRRGVAWAAADRAGRASHPPDRRSGARRAVLHAAKPARQLRRPACRRSVCGHRRARDGGAVARCGRLPVHR
jgi:23S rRNA pseudouridine2605 synthase